jgi:hypothetical protein
MEIFNLGLTKTSTGEGLEDYRQPNILLELNCDDYRKISVIFLHRMLILKYIFSREGKMVFSGVYQRITFNRPVL